MTPQIIKVFMLEQVTIVGLCSPKAQQCKTETPTIIDEKVSALCKGHDLLCSLARKQCKIVQQSVAVISEKLVGRKHVATRIDDYCINRWILVVSVLLQQLPWKWIARLQRKIQRKPRPWAGVARKRPHRNHQAPTKAQPPIRKKVLRLRVARTKIPPPTKVHQVAKNPVEGRRHQEVKAAQSINLLQVKNFWLLKSGYV